MFDNSKIRSTELYATLSQATKDVTAIREWLYASKDRIDEHILENLNAFDKKVKEALQNYKNLSDEKLNMLKELYKKVVYPFDYVSDKEPTMANVNETWFKTDEAKIFKFIKNPQNAFIWFNEEKENINFILSLIGDLKKEDKKEETSKNEIKVLEQNLSNKQKELENIKKQIKEALAKAPPQNVDNLNKKKTQLEQEITKMQKDLNHKQNELKQIQKDKSLVSQKMLSDALKEKDKSLVSQKMLSDALKEKVGLKGDETLNGNKTLNGNNIFNGTNTFNQALTSQANPTNDNHLT
ncbi:hypothetical protein LLY50_001578, partial [Campylobacter jejuni]|nr:hypothetical protein [Campylobacter jejuni]